MDNHLRYIVPLLLAAAVIGALTAYSWRHRHAPGARAFSLLSGAIAWWLAAYAGEIAAPSLAGKVFWAQVGYVGVVSVPLMWIIFALTYTGNQRATPRLFRMLVIEPSFILLMAATNSWHWLLWSAVQLPTSGSFPSLDVDHGPVFWIHVVSSYTMLLFGIIIIVLALLRAPNRYRSQSVSLLVGATLPIVGNILYITDLSPVPQLDLTPFGFAVGSLVWGWSMFRSHMFQIAPIAYHNVVEGIGDAVIVLDRDGRIVRLNPAAQPLFGTSHVHLVGRYIADLLTWWPQSLASNVGYRQEITLGTGEFQQYFDLHMTPIGRRFNQGCVIVLRDVSERVRTEHALRLLYEQQSHLVEQLASAKQLADAANTAKTEFISFISHELKTPMSAIRGYADLLSLGFAGPVNQQQNEFLHSVRSNVDRMVSLIAELSDISRIETGQLMLEYGSVNLVETVAQVLDANNALILAQHQQVHLEIEPEANLVWGDRTRIIQILTNLISNAAKYTAVGGSITIHAKLHSAANEPQVCLSVNDTGVGIAEHDQAHMFEKFFRAADVKQRSIPGTGLGLHITRQLVDLHGGSIWFESTVGSGTTFFVTLPCYTNHHVLALADEHR